MTVDLQSRCNRYICVRESAKALQQRYLFYKPLWSWFLLLKPDSHFAQFSQIIWIEKYLKTTWNRLFHLLMLRCHRQCLSHCDRNTWVGQQVSVCTGESLSLVCDKCRQLTSNWSVFPAWKRPTLGSPSGIAPVSPFSPNTCHSTCTSLQPPDLPVVISTRQSPSGEQ